MSSREEILKIAEENVSIAKYLKPEVRAEVLAEEEKIQNLIEKSPVKNKDEIKIILMNLGDIVAQYVDIKNQPHELSPIDKDQQKINRIEEIISKFETIQNDLKGIDEKDCTLEESVKKAKLTIFILHNQIIFIEAQNIILKEQNELLRDENSKLHHNLHQHKKNK